MKCCWVVKSKQVQCKECREIKDFKKELDKYQLEVYGVGGEFDVFKKKKKRFLVICDFCGREFVYVLGMQYYKLIEYFDEKFFFCEECGVKFVVNFILKNYFCFYIGDCLFMCKYCFMIFIQVFVLVYYIKKKYLEGKMYVCQYCDVVFVQFIELFCYVRIYIGDKFYVCRDCGKGFW